MVSLQHVIAWVVIYTVVAFIISRYYSHRVNDNWSISGPMLTIRTEYGKSAFKYIAEKGRSLWHGWGVIGVITALFTSVLALVTITLSAYGIFLQPDASGIEGPTDLVVIPGVNRFLPLSAAPELLVALVIAMVVHEAGHAIYCVLGDIEIKATGVILGAFLPMGAFVEPDEEEQNEADTLDQLKMYSAGITNNYAVFVISMVLLFVLVPLLISPVTGVAVGTVFSDSPAENSGMESGEVITQVNGIDVEEPQDIREIASDKGIDKITTDNGDEYNMSGGVYISRAADSSGIDVSRTVEEINGQELTSSQGFEEYLRDYEQDTADVLYSSGETAEIYVGLHVTGQEDSNQLSDTLGIGRGDSLLILSVDGEKVNTEEQFKSVVESNVGEKVDVTYRSDGETKTTTYQVSESEFSSIVFSDTPSSISTGDIGIDVFPKDEYYNVLSFDDTVSGTLSNVYTTVFLPIFSIVPGSSFGLPGFTPFIQNFYTVGMGGGILSSAIFFIISVIFWTSWINVNLAVFNCLPTFALDGGHIVKAIVWSLPFNIPESYESYIILGIKSVAALPFIFLLLGPLLL